MVISITYESSLHAYYTAVKKAPKEWTGINRTTKEEGSQVIDTISLDPYGSSVETIHKIQLT